MNKTLLIFRHEFLKTIKRTGFIVLTLSLPVLALLGMGIYRIASGVERPAAKATEIGYVDEAGGFDRFTTQGNITMVRFDSREAATQALVAKSVKEYSVIPADFLSTGVINRFTLQRELTPPTATDAAIRKFISDNLLAGKLPENAIARVQSPLSLVTTTLTSTGAVAPQQGGLASFIVPAIFSFLLGLSLIFSSTYVLQSLSEEKENRLMEILLSSVSTRQLLTGKVLGLGAAGLVQVVVWVISFPLLLKLASSYVGGFLSSIQVPAGFWVLGVVYFILGYLVFAVLSASVAAVSSTVQEAQGLAGIYGIFNFAPFWFLSLIMLYPNSPTWIVFGAFPLTAPVLTMMRLGVTGVPAWQLALSLAVLIASVVGGLLLAARLLRVYLLMYGKRPGIVQIARSLRGP
jgi:ABC-2 type transport system permease protein